MRFSRWLPNKSIGSRLGWGFAIVVALMVAYGGLTLKQMRDLEAQSNLLFQHPFAVTQAVAEVELHILKIHREMKDLSHTLELEGIQKHSTQVDAYENEALHQLETVRQRFLGDPKLVMAVHDALVSWRPIRQEVAQLRLQEHYAAADAVTRGKGAEHVALLETSLEMLKKFAWDKAIESIANSEAVLQRAQTTTFVLLAGTVLLGTVIAVAITRSIRDPLVHLDRAAAQMAEGNLEQQVPVHAEDELGRLSRTFNMMANSIREQTDEIRLKNEENERLLLNILPVSIAERLKSNPGVIADQFESASVLFADIVGFTPLSRALSAEEMVAWLNEIYSAFDEFVQKHGIEKIRTIGDNYMVASGVPVKRDDHALAITRLAIDMRDYINALPPARGHRADFRIGINSGSMVGGVIGTHKFQYDLWGDAVNTSSRMESHGIPGHIQVTKSTYMLIRDEFRCEPRGQIPVKGKGEMETYFVIGPM